MHNSQSLIFSSEPDPRFLRGRSWFWERIWVGGAVCLRRTECLAAGHPVSRLHGSRAPCSIKAANETSWTTEGSRQRTRWRPAASVAPHGPRSHYCTPRPPGVTAARPDSVRRACHGADSRARLEAETACSALTRPVSNARCRAPPLLRPCLVQIHRFP